MTKQEGEALATRLVRLWEPKLNPVYGVDGAYFGFQCYLEYFEEGASLEFAIHPLDHRPMSALKQYANRRLQAGYLYFRDGELRVIEDEGDPVEDSGAFTRTWLETFRRNSFLMGCDIEASAHEKAEWIQGFTREEIEAWNLKM